MLKENETVLSIRDSARVLPRTTIGPKYQAYNLANFERIPQIQKLNEEQRFIIRVVGSVFPFKTNRYVVDELIDWDRVPDDPIFVLTFPQRDMLQNEDFDTMASLHRRGATRAEIQEAANAIRLRMNPHPAGQLEYNVPDLEGVKLDGMQHKYRETLLFFPSQGQTCHAYCSFCFRWPQFVGMTGMKFAAREAATLVDYLRAHPEVTDVLFTGGDPLIMRTETLAAYIHSLLDANLPGLQTIRIGTKALSYWPFRFLTDPDAQDLLTLFREVGQRGKHLAIMAHYNHARELQTSAAQAAVAAVRETGAQIRSQSPILRHINDDPEVWTSMWREQVRLGIVPYYMFLVRDTGAQHYFGVPLARAWEIYHNALSRVSGLARTARGPSMSATPGKVHIIGVSEVQGEKVFVLQFLQGRNPDWVTRPFFARYDESALWLDDLQPALGEERFFFEGNPVGA